MPNYSNELRFTKNLHRLFLEAEAQWTRIQAYYMSLLSDHPKIILWGKNNITNWDDLNVNQKMTHIFNKLSATGILNKLRKFINDTPLAKKINPMIYDISDVAEPYTGSLPEHLKQLKDSKLYIQFRDIALEAFEPVTQTV